MRDGRIKNSRTICLFNPNKLRHLFELQLLSFIFTVILQFSQRSRFFLSLFQIYGDATQITVTRTTIKSFFTIQSNGLLMKYFQREYYIIAWTMFSSALLFYLSCFYVQHFYIIIKNYIITNNYIITKFNFFFDLKYIGKQIILFFTESFYVKNLYILLKLNLLNSSVLINCVLKVINTSAAKKYFITFQYL